MHCLFEGKPCRFFPNNAELSDYICYICDFKIVSCKLDWLQSTVQGRQNAEIFAQFVAQYDSMCTLHVVLQRSPIRKAKRSIRLTFSEVKAIKRRFDLA